MRWAGNGDEGVRIGPTVVEVIGPSTVKVAKVRRKGASTTAKMLAVSTEVKGRLWQGVAAAATMEMPW